MTADRKMQTDELTIVVDAVLQRLAPNALTCYKEGLRGGHAILARHGIGESRLRLAHFLAQILHESGGFTADREKLSYSADRLVAVWPNRFVLTAGDPKKINAVEYARQPEKLANLVYGNRLGNAGPGDGYKFRGRGLLQVTGMSNYRSATERVRRYHPDCPDFVENPEAILDPAWCVAVAASYWDSRGCNACADQDDLQGVTKLINGGLVGISERTVWLKKVKGLLP